MMKKYLLFCLLSLFATTQTPASTNIITNATRSTAVTIHALTSPNVLNDSVVMLNWLENHKLFQPEGVSWGVPWPRGTVKKNQVFTLSNTEQSNIALQSWPLAYWPDGSLKWSGFAAVVKTGTGPLKLRKSKGKANSIVDPIKVKENNQVVRINSGLLQCVIPKNGSVLIDSLIVENRVVGSNGRLECILQNGPDDEMESPVREKYLSKINKVTVEQNGPVRAVVRVQGTIQSETSQRSWLPFSIRMYFYAGSKAVRFVNTITYTGDDQKDFIKGLGLVFSVPMREQMHNRHVRFAGEGDGIWAEPIRPLVGRSFFMLNGKNVFPEQLAGKAVAGIDQFVQRTQVNIKDLPVWNDYKLVQNTADGFNIQKRTNTKSTWIDVAAGKRATGLAFVGDTKGGLAVGVKDFWQSYPAALEIRNAAKDVAELHVWLWSPFSDAMDMRHYDTIAHGLDATYEDVQPGFSTPYGINRTSELTLFASADVPSNEMLSNEANICSQPPLLVATPEYLHSVNTFGIWSLPNRSDPTKIKIEDQLDKAIGFYQKEIDIRNWYGFWNYGDVMHSYDNVRHSWRYDIGGFAWDNTELGTDMWLWYSFLRTGRADIFRMAEAMTRHTSEVDVYHLGKFAGLGSRHNVRHWGDGSKEVRESQAPYRRFYYYLTTDERTGDMMREVAETADLAMTQTDPLREILPKTQYPTHARVGPDWFALIGNWMTEWERTGDKIWRDKIMAGVNSFAKMPYGFFSGAQGAFGYDPATKKMYQLNDTLGYIHLSVLMGGPEVNYELTDLLQEPAWNKLWLQFCALYGAPREEVMKAFGKNVTLGTTGNNFARLAAYVAKTTNDPKYAQRAWSEFMNESIDGKFNPVVVDGVNVLKPLQEVPKISTNSTSQWCLNAIELLEMIGDRDKMPVIIEIADNKEKSGPDLYQKGNLLYKEDFDSNMKDWISEYSVSPNSSIAIKNSKLILDVSGGATVWLNKKLSGNMLIEYKRKVILNNGVNDRLSDLNQFWMASDPKTSNLFTRTGVFSQYDSLLLYYVGFGGNTNSTTRFRKYNGKGERVLYTDLKDKAHLLEPNKEYSIKMTVYNGLTKFFVDDVEYFSFQDPEPLREGYFGFRITKSRQEIDDFRIYALK